MECGSVPGVRGIRAGGTPRIGDTLPSRCLSAPGGGGDGEVGGAPPLSEPPLFLPLANVARFPLSPHRVTPAL